MTASRKAMSPDEPDTKTEPAPEPAPAPEPEIAPAPETEPEPQDTVALGHAGLLAATIGLYRAAEPNIPTAVAHDAWTAIATSADELDLKLDDAA